MLPVAEEIGRHFVIGLSGPQLSDADRSSLRDLKPLGVILRAHNFAADLPYEEWLETLATLEREVRQLTERATPIIALDHEGGRVHRTPPPLTHFPSARAYATQAARVAEAMAVELKSIGVNVNFAPVADIDSNPKNPVIGRRAFSNNAHEVVHAAIAFADALRKGGITPVAKHFPGHGDTHQDSHEELPELSLTLPMLQDRELLPFKALANAHAPVLLTAHILFPLIDPDFPATLSPLVLRQFAREECQFAGVIMSDDMDMKAIADNFSDEEVALQSFTAGCDVLLFNHDPSRALHVARLTEQLLDSGTLDVDSFSESSARIEQFIRTELKSHTPHALSTATLMQHQALATQLPKDSTS